MEPTTKHTHFGAISVPLSIFWSDPEKSEYEMISLRSSIQPAKWSKSLDVSQRLWLVNNVNTSAIFGERVALLNQQGNWLLIGAVNQRTQRNQFGQVGWVPTDQVCSNSTYLMEHLSCPEGAICVPKAMLFQNASMSKPLRWLSYQVRLPIRMEREDYFEVSLPDGCHGYLSRHEMRRSSDLCFSRKNVIAQARQFIGLKYIWGGTSSYGFDCSGFMFRLYQSQGIYIPRNSTSQSQEGLAIGKQNLLPGDLLFFSTENGKGYIHHVGMYIGNGIMIHAPSSNSEIKETRIDDNPYREEYWGARRYADYYS